MYCTRTYVVSLSYEEIEMEMELGPLNGTIQFIINSNISAAFSIQLQQTENRKMRLKSFCVFLWLFLLRQST